MAAVDELRAFLAAEAPRLRDTWGDSQEWEARRDWHRTLHGGGWAAPGWPVEHGGRGLTAHQVFSCEEALYEAGCPALAGVLGLKNIGPTLITWGNERQLQHVPRILDASEIWCQGFSEPDAGSDLASLRTRAELVGDDYVINGQKIWTSTGLQATHMLLLARTDPAAPKHSGITALLVPMDAAGIERRPIRQISGDEDFAEVFFTDVTVSASAVLGPVNQGWQVTRTTLGYERAGVAVLASRLHEEVLATVRGGNIPAALSDDVVARYVESRVLTWLGEQLLDRLAAGQAPGAEQSVIKLVWSETGQRLAATRLALTGAAAGRAGAAVDGYLNSRQLTIAAGTTQIVKNILAERVLGLPRD